MSKPTTTPNNATVASTEPTVSERLDRIEQIINEIALALGVDPDDLAKE